MPHKRDIRNEFDDSAWLDLFAPLHYARDTDLADRVAKLLDYLYLELENGGAMGATNVGLSIENALRLIFPFTSLGKTCMILFLVSLGKDFPKKPDEFATLSEAMKRTKAALERAAVEHAKPRHRQSRRRK